MRQISRFRSMNFWLLYAAFTGLLALCVTFLVPFDNWLNLSGILVFQPSRLPIYAGFFALGLLAQSSGWQLKKSSLC
jgi:hypothetical protein